MDRELSMDIVTGFIPEHVQLVYIDTRYDGFDKSKEALQKCIEIGYTDGLYDIIEDKELADQEEMLDSYIKDLGSKLVKSGYNKDLVDAFLEENDSTVREIFRERDTSDTVGDMLRNTDSQIMFYDTGLYCDADWDASDAKKRLLRIKIKDLLGLKTAAYDKDILEMIENGFCGNLEIFFKCSVSDFVDGNEDVAAATAIKFRDINLAIVSHSSGSRYHNVLKGSEVIMPFDRNRIFIDGTVGYSYTDSICGMSHDWCDDTIVEFTADKSPEQLPLSGLQSFREQEDRYKQRFREGRCSWGDMNITRHRKTVYINEYPCGMHCKDCGTFWVD